MYLRTLHRFSAFGLLAFIAMHVTNHLVAIIGIQSHIAFMDAARVVYRAPLVEGILLFCVVFQILSGLWFVVQGWRQRTGFVAWLQACSGLYIAFFLLIHVGAVLYGRALLNLDTNFFYAAAGMHVPPNQCFFIPYYFLSLLALSAHLGCAFYWFLKDSSKNMRQAALVIPIIIGSTVSTIIVLSLAGKFQPLDIPAKYKATYAKNAAYHSLKLFPNDAGLALMGIFKNSKC
jgi:succinate dehydrogenase/fumarate reductase cytochrome b subunit